MKTPLRILIPGLLIFLLFSACATIDDSRNQSFDSVNREKPKRVLFCGDSITRGELGTSFLNLLKEQYPDYELVNLGQNGDTVSGIMERTVTHLKENTDYDMIIISAGHNDILLPVFIQQSIGYRFIVEDKRRKGSIPAKDYSEFISTYSTFINSVRAITSSPIVIVTLSCLNEDMNAYTNQQRLIYNQGIRNLSTKKNTGLADVGSIFNKRLNNLDCRDFLMSNLFETALFDRSKSKTLADAEKLSRERFLHLTIDGAHLNPEGAQIYSNTISPFLKNL